MSIEPNITMGGRPDGSPWVMFVEFGGGVAINAYGNIISGRDSLTVDEARSRADSLIAAAGWVVSGKSAALEAVPALATEEEV